MMNDMEKIKAQIDEWRTTYEVYEISYRHFTKCGESTTPLENDLIFQNTCVFRKEETSLRMVIEILDFFYASVLKRKGVIRENTTADVVPVIRCKDCRYVQKNGPFMWCNGHETTPDWFCADGERKKES